MANLPSRSYRYTPGRICIDEWGKLKDIKLMILAGSLRHMTVRFYSKSSQPIKFYVPYVTILIQRHPTDYLSTLYLHEFQNFLHMKCWQLNRFAFQEKGFYSYLLLTLVFSNYFDSELYQKPQWNAHMAFTFNRDWTSPW